MPKIQKQQIYAYLSERLVQLLDLIEVERGLKSRSHAVESVLTDTQKLREPRMREFLLMEGQKRGLDTENPMDIAMDIVRDFMRGIIS